MNFLKKHFVRYLCYALSSLKVNQCLLILLLFLALLVFDDPESIALVFN
jgi:hypothetical protein